MADYRYAVGSFAARTNSGSQTISVQDANGAFPIKAVIFWGTKQNTSGFDSVLWHFQGWSDGTNDRCMFSYRQDTNPLSESYKPRSYMSKLASIILSDPASFTSIFISAAISSLDTGSFTLDWSFDSRAVGTQFNVHYLVIGGTSTTCVVGSVINPVSTGNQAISVTGIGQITGLLTMQVYADNAPTAIAGVAACYTPSFGFTDGTNQGAIGTRGIEFQASSKPYRYQRTNRMSVACDDTTEQTAISIVSLGSGTFTANWIATQGPLGFSTAGFFYLAIQGPTVLVGATVQRTTVGSTDLSLGFNPGVILAISDGHAASTSPQQDTQYSLGAFDGVTHAENWIGDKYGVTTFTSAREHQDDRLITCATVNNPNADVTLNSYATAAFGSNKVTLTWPVVDATARQILYVAFQGAVTIAPIAKSGIYKLVPDKRNDTVYTAFSPITTESVAIPEPFGETGLLGDGQ